MKAKRVLNFKSLARTTHIKKSFRLLALLFAVTAIAAASFILQNQKFTAKAAPVVYAVNTSVDGLWQQIDKSGVNAKTAQANKPRAFGAASLDKTALSQLLARAPMEFTAAAKGAEVVMTLPMPDGSFARFRVEESPIMAAELAAKFPQLKTYKGQGLDDPTATTRFDWTPQGLHAIVLSTQGTAFIEPLTQGDTTNYLTYFNRDLSTEKLALSCLISEADIAEAERRNASLPVTPLVFTTGSSLRTYRLAVAATVEFTNQFGGGTESGALTAITTIINQVNAIYQREATITFQLIASELSIIYTTAEGDSYTNSSPSTMLNENQTNLTNVIGAANYDIGHVFGDITVGAGSLSFSGIAQLGVVCAASKGRGASTMGGTSSFPHSIFISGVAHEFAHQFNAGHTFNTTSGGCNGQRSGTTAYEPGSGSTLMGYSICSPSNLQQLNDLYFHTGSIEAIVNWANGTGACASTTATGNSAPTISALSNYSIPANTPFTLNASATDANGDAMTYSWEEFDLGNASPPDTDDGTRPLFRSYTSSTSTSRTFPPWQYILNNANVPPSTYTCGSGSCLFGEVMPTTTRTMNFRFTARDNRSAGGGTTNAAMQVGVVSTGAAFAVTQPNTSSASWTANSTQQVTWNVAGTTASPINAANVKISLSTNGGTTFPTVLAASTPNDGSENITVPNITVASARVKVEAVGNIFFDVSDASFPINVVTSTPCNSGAITIESVTTPDAASLYSSNVTVSGLNTGTVKVSVTLNNFSHTWPRDVDIMLEAPTGQKVMLMSDVGGTNPGVSGLTLTIDEEATSNFPASGTGFVSGSYKPTNLNDTDGGGDTFPAPATNPPTNTLSDLKGLNPNGTWRLWVMDDVAVDTGSISGGWCLNISTPASPSAVSLVSFNATIYGDGQVLTEWKTGYEVDNLGFNVYREEGGNRTRINQQPIAGSALLAGDKTVLTAGEAYVWSDTLTSSQGVQYWLEDLDLKGKSTMHGPFPVKYALGKSPSPERSQLLAKLGAQKGTQANGQGSFVKQRTASSAQSALLAKAGGQVNLPGQQAVKFFIKGEGFYRVRQPEIVAAGLPREVDPRRLQMFVDGREIPINVIGEADGRFDTSDAVEFYAIGLDSPVTAERVYWLTFGNQPGLRIKQVKGQGRPASASSFVQTIERKDRSIYFSSLRNGERENFFGAIVMNEPVNQELALTGVVPAALQPAAIEVALQGVTQTTHRVAVQLNGWQLGTMVFNGQENKTVKFTVPPTLLKEGINLAQLKSEDASDISLVDTIRIKYQHAFTAVGNALRFTAPAGERLTVSNFTSRAIRVFDVTSADAVQELSVETAAFKNAYSINVTAGETGQRELLAIADEKAFAPSDSKTNRASNWRNPANSADFIIISHQEFVDALQPLKTLRQSQGYQVVVVDVEDIFDEFNYGNKSPQAIKEFLRFTKSNWRVAPRFVMFAGDSTYDPKDYLGTGNRDFTPTKIVDTAIMETASDDWFADFDDDSVPEIAVGRLPASDPAMATDLVAKLLRYEQSASLQEALLVADANDSFDFEQASSALREVLPSELQVQELRRGQTDAVAAKKQLLDAINRGQKFINYAGHGSVGLWRGNLLAVSDVAGLTNQDRLPVFISMTCLNGYFHDPLSQSLGEALLKSRNGGAAAVWASSGLNLPNGQAPMNRELYRALFNSGENRLTLGEAIQRAKASIEDLDVRKTWIFLGDPTMQMKR
jgi:subtilisin-like proprotein convertase family protein